MPLLSEGGFSLEGEVEEGTDILARPTVTQFPVTSGLPLGTFSPPPPPPPPPPTTVVPTTTVVPGATQPTPIAPTPTITTSVTPTPTVTTTQPTTVKPMTQFTNVPTTTLPTIGTVPTIVPDVFGIPQSGQLIQGLAEKFLGLNPQVSPQPQESEPPNECPGAFSVFVPGVGCVNLGDLGPGGAPAVTDPMSGQMADTLANQGAAVRGRYGVGVVPMVRQRMQRRCPPGMALGDDGVCYKGLRRTARLWDPGMKPLLTGGDRAAIRKAAAAGRKLDRAKRSLKKAARALEKVS